MLGYSFKKKEKLAEIIEVIYAGKIMTVNEISLQLGRSESAIYPYLRTLHRDRLINMIRGTLERGSNCFYFIGRDFTNELRYIARKKYSRAG